MVNMKSGLVVLEICEPKHTADALCSKNAPGLISCNLAKT